jgi:murein DD-endopeptidase
VEAQGVECGNGMVIDHGNGWETQYCHLRNGSVAVPAGAQVKTGDVLGMVGLSGMTQFPHVHFSVRHQGEIVDPFIGHTQESGCQVDRQPLWDRPLAYDPTGLISAGFSTVQPTFDDLWAGRFAKTEFSTESPALIFWVHAYGILKGDVQRFRLFDPNGREFLNQETEIDAPHRTWMSFVGKRNTSDKPIIPGTWRGEYQLERDNKVVFTTERSIEVK